MADESDSAITPQEEESNINADHDQSSIPVSEDPPQTQTDADDDGNELAANDSNNIGDGPGTTEAPTDSLELTKTQIVNQLVKTIKLLRQENAILELRVGESAKHNKVLQLQIDILIKKMELLENFMAQVKQMDEVGNETKDEKSTSEQVDWLICRNCKKRINKHDKAERKSLDLSDSEEVDAQELMDMWDSESTWNDTGAQNPLLIDVVVANVLEYLPISTLLKCRLVSHLWYKEATYLLKQRRLLTINRDNVDKLPTMFDLSLDSLSSEPLSFSGNFLFRKVRFEIGFLVKAYRDILEQFLKRYGPEIHNFSLYCEQENSSILYTEEVRSIFLPYLKNVQILELSVPTKITERQTIYEDIRPNPFIYDQLTTLKLRQIDVSLDIGGYSISVVKELLKVGPNLRSLGIETHTKEVVTRVLHALNDKECRNITNQLTELFLDAFVTEEHLRLLLPLDCKLKTLQLSYCTVDVGSEMFEAVLFKQRTTLRTLIIGDYQKRTTSNSLPMIIKLPVMRELRHLKFVDPLFPDHRQIMLNPLIYSEQLPCLTEMSFEHETGKPTGPHYFQDVFVCSPSCKTLHTLRISHGLTDPQLVPAAAKIFPNLKRLELANASDLVIQAVWRELTSIKVMYLELNPTNLNIDSLMTGIPDQVCRRIQEKNLFSQVDMMNALDIIRTEAGVWNLNELETLRIDGYASSLITAVTGYLAFSHMQNLTSVSIKSDIITLSRECRRVLGEKLHLSQFEMF